MSLQAVIDLARSYLGYTESPPNSNNTIFGERYGLQGQPWCCLFLWFVFNKAGEGAAFFGGAKTASCGTLLRWYQGQGFNVPASQVRPGDIVILNFHGTQETEHCGLVVETAPLYPTIGWIKTIEGNTTPGEEGSQDNGGSVALKVRYPRQIVGVCRPQYKEEPMPKIKDYKGHWAEDALDWAYEKGFINGYEDGTTRPDAALTRAELVTILRRYDDYRFGSTEK